MHRPAVVVVRIQGQVKGGLLGPFYQGFWNPFMHLDSLDHLIQMIHFLLNFCGIAHVHIIGHTHRQCLLYKHLSHTAVSQFCVQLTKVYKAETSCNQVFIDSDMYMVKISSSCQQHSNEPLRHYK